MLVIRESQIAALGRHLLDRFALKALDHLRDNFPEMCADMGDEEVFRFTQNGIRRARRYGIETEYDLLRFLNLMFFLGADFDSGEVHTWVLPILKDAEASPTTRMN